MNYQINPNYPAFLKALNRRPASSKRRRVQRDLHNACNIEALEGRTLLSGSALATPAFLTAIPSSATTVNLAWNTDTTATSYTVLRSTDGMNYTQIATISSGSATTFADTAAPSGHYVSYEIQAHNGSANSAFSNWAGATTPVATVSGLSPRPPTRAPFN